jgi:PAS domain S-box-containing protein
VREIRQLTPDQLVHTNLVLLEGVLTYHDPSSQLTFLQDDTGGIAIAPSPSDPALRSGMRVRVLGQAASVTPGRPLIASRVTPLGPGEFPRPIRGAHHRLLAGSLEAQWVWVRGIIRQISTNNGYRIIRLAIRGGEIEAVLSHAAEIQQELLPNADITVAGVAHLEALDNGRRRLVRIFVPGWEQLGTWDSPDLEPFALALRPINQVLQILEQSPGPHHRARIAGTVTAFLPGDAAFIHDASGSLRILGPSLPALSPGDRVEVAGFPDVDLRGPLLADSIVHVTGFGPQPPPQDVSGPQALSPTREGELIRIHGWLVGRADQTNRTLLWAESQGVMFECVLPRTPGSPRVKAAKQSMVQFTGICTGSRGDKSHGQAFQVLLRDDADVAVIEDARWWTSRTTLITLGVMGFILLTTATWIVTLRRQVAAQTAQIRDRLEREAVLQTRYSNLVENAPDLILTYDTTGRILSTNQAGERLSGYSRQEVVGKPLGELLVCPGGVDALLVPPGTGVVPPPGMELVLVSRDGERVPVEARWQPLAIPGQPVEMQCIARDIRERRRVEEALRKSEEHLRLAIDAAQMGTWELYPATGQVLWNTWVYEQYGVREGMFAGTVDAVLDHIHPADRQHIRKTIELTSQTAEPFQLEYRIIRPDGQRRWRMMQGHGLRNAKGEVVRVIGVSQDVTPRKLAEQALRDREEIYRAMFEKNRAAKLLLDPETGEIVDANPAAAGFYGLPLASLRGMRLARFTRGDAAAVHALLRQAREGETDFFHLHQVLASGEERNVEIFSGLLTVGGRSLLFCIVLDVSDKVKAAEAMRRLNEELEARVEERTEQLRQRVSEVEELNSHMVTLVEDLQRAHLETAEAARRSEAANEQLQATNQELEAFSYSVSHDLRAPLRHIAGYVTILEETQGSRLDPEGQRHLATIAGAARRMAKLIDDLLDFSRIGRAQLNMRPVRMASLVTDVLREFRPESEDRQVIWRIHELPDVEADPALLRQVLANLVENALKYTRPRARAVIEIGRQPDKTGTAEHTFFIRDNGVGFDMAYSAKLFGVFQRLHSASQFEGTGIGLANVRRIIARHGGRTWAEAEPEQGATFFFTLPRRGRPRDESEEIQAIGA